MVKHKYFKINYKIMPMTINVLWENKQYWVMLKFTWQKEIDLTNLPKISLKKPIEQTQKVWKIIKNGIFWAISYLKSKMNSRPPKRDKEEEKKNDRKYRNVNEYKHFRKNKKSYYKNPRVNEMV